MVPLFSGELGPENIKLKRAALSSGFHTSDLIVFNEVNQLKEGIN